MCGEREKGVGRTTFAITVCLFRKRSARGISFRYHLVFRLHDQNPMKSTLLSFGLCGRGQRTHKVTHQVPCFEREARHIIRRPLRSCRQGQTPMTATISLFESRGETEDARHVVLVPVVRKRSTAQFFGCHLVFAGKTGIPWV